MLAGVELNLPFHVNEPAMGFGPEVGTAFVAQSEAGDRGALAQAALEGGVEARLVVAVNPVPERRADKRPFRHAEQAAGGARHELRLAQTVKAQDKVAAVVCQQAIFLMRLLERGGCAGPLLAQGGDRQEETEGGRHEGLEQQGLSRRLKAAGADRPQSEDRRHDADPADQRKEQGGGAEAQAEAGKDQERSKKEDGRGVAGEDP